MKAVCICIFISAEIFAILIKFFYRVHQLEFSVCFEPFTYAIYIRKTL